MNDAKLMEKNKDPKVMDQETKKDLDRSENDGFSVMYDSEKKETLQPHLKDKIAEILEEVSQPTK